MHKRKMGYLGGIFLLFLLLCAIVGCIQHPGTTSAEDTIPGTENTISTEDTTSGVEIIDGDTFRLETGEKVRLIGIDAPELSQPGGVLSREYLTHLLLGKPITLERGSEDRDKYNRQLRFVYINNLCINEEMIRQGYAEARYLPENPIRDYYLQLEIQAEITKAGLWSDNIFQPRFNLDWDANLPVIDWSEADNYYNEYVIVEGTIINTYNSGRVCFLNFHSNYQYCTAVIFACDLPGFPYPPNTYYLDKKVQIIGIIKEYRGSPEIIIKTPDQIRILN
jgi:micrococcal nuclease